MVRFWFLLDEIWIKENACSCKVIQNSLKSYRIRGIRKTGRHCNQLDTLPSWSPKPVGEPTAKNTDDPL